MNDLINLNQGNLDLKRLESILSDHQDGTDSIYNHLNDTATGYARTFDAMIFVAEKREAWIARGSPCSSKFVRYQV